MSGRTARLLISTRWQRARIGSARSWLEVTNCILHDNALCPGACPCLENPVLVRTVLNTGYKTPFRLLVICHQQKRKLIKTIQILVKNRAEIFASRVLIFAVSKYLTMSLLCHSSTSRGLSARVAPNLLQTPARTLSTGFSVNPG